MSEIPCNRRGPSTATRKRLLREQDYRCLYCERKFGSTLWKGNREIHLCITWDHSVPLAYSHSNQQANFVAACHICNAIKGSRIFSSIEEIRIHVAQRRKEKGYSEMRPMLETLSPETPTSKILQPELPEV